MHLAWCCPSDGWHRLLFNLQCLDLPSWAPGLWHRLRFLQLFSLPLCRGVQPPAPAEHDFHHLLLRHQSQPTLRNSDCLPNPVWDQQGHPNEGAWGDQRLAVLHRNTSNFLHHLYRRHADLGQEGHADVSDHTAALWGCQKVHRALHELIPRPIRDLRILKEVKFEGDEQHYLQGGDVLQKVPEDHVYHVRADY